MRPIIRLSGVLLSMAALAAIFQAQNLIAQGQQAPPTVPTFRVSSNLVFLDVTVLDKKGRPVVTGLTKDDFTITEDKQPQRIFSFEAPEMHVMGPNPEDSNPAGKAPVTIFVLDRLNSSFEVFAFIRDEVRRFLMTQPPQLASPAELMVIGNESLEMLQGYTRSRADLISVLDHLPPALPYKKMNASFVWERFDQSIDALQQIALQNKGVPGRKNIVWVGHGGPGINLFAPVFSGKIGDELKQYVHSTANLLVNSRISLFVIYPGLPINGGVTTFSALQAAADIGDDDPFAGDVNFGLFVNETGGKLFYNHNDVDMEIKRSVRMGAEYYTLTYQPQNIEPNGKFRRIRVSLRDRNLRVVTKAGYFAPDNNAPIDRRQQKMVDLADAAESTIPFTALDVRLSGLVRHPDTRTAEFTVQLKSKNVAFLPTDDGKNAANLILAAASLDKYRSILASKVVPLTLLANSRDPVRLPDVVSSFKLMIRVPRKTHSVRVVMESEEGGFIGAADLDRKAIDAAPAIPTAEPQLTTRGQDQVVPASSPEK
jgi:VWFA-related protein